MLVAVNGGCFHLDIYIKKCSAYYTLYSSMLPRDPPPIHLDLSLQYAVLEKQTRTTLTVGIHIAEMLISIWSQLGLGKQSTGMPWQPLTLNNLIRSVAMPSAHCEIKTSRVLNPAPLPPLLLSLSGTPLFHWDSNTSLNQVSNFTLAQLFSGTVKSFLRTPQAHHRNQKVPRLLYCRFVASWNVNPYQPRL